MSNAACTTSWNPGRAQAALTGPAPRAAKPADPPQHLTTADVWQAHKRLNAALVRGAPSNKVPTDLISLLRFATGQADVLEPFPARVEQRFNLWIERQIKAGQMVSDEQMAWLKAIKDYLAANVEIASADLTRDQPFSDLGARWWRRGDCSGRSRTGCWMS